MIFNTHSNLRDTHAFLGASNFHWINYDEEKLSLAFASMQAKARGTKLHSFAAECIELGQKLPKSRKTLNMYVNDAIGFKMTPEQVLFYSVNCYGTADAICFRGDKLRIHDLKTGTTPAHMEQLFIYNALFCLEYKIKPSDIDTELRLYQSNDIVVCKPEVEKIVPIMDKIIAFDKYIEEYKRQEA